MEIWLFHNNGFSLFLLFFGNFNQISQSLMMKHTFTKLLNAISKLIPLNLFPLLLNREVISIFYHAVSDGEMAHVRHLYPVVPVPKFIDAIRYLKKDYVFISYDQLHDHITNGTHLPKNAVHLSFDDGFAECYSVVRPILLEQNIPCTFFLTIDWLDNPMMFFRHQISLCVNQIEQLQIEEQNKSLGLLNSQLSLSLVNSGEFKQWITSFRTPEYHVLEEICRILDIDILSYLRDSQPYLTTNQIKKMHAEGFTIGAHGLSHRKLGFIPDADMESEIVESCNAVQSITGQSIVPFSFPQSAANLNRSILGNILNRHPMIGLLFDTKDLRTDKEFLVNRVWAERPLTPARKLHPLPEILLNAYRDAWVYGIKRSFLKERGS
jgi:peptidoglycan/xylan/chitin deacetylase (PgdA/CDA1 family)